jgi:hypothetical protein
VVVVEWAERAAGRLPDRYLLVELAITGPDSREVRVTRAGTVGRPVSLLLAIDTSTDQVGLALTTARRPPS